MKLQTLLRAGGCSALLLFHLTGQTTAPAPRADWRIPIHTAVGSGGAAYGTWAVGSTYKASFHDGFVFYPLLGPARREHRPWRWRTVRIEAGGTALLDREAPRHDYSDWRYEYDYGAVVEAYDLLAAGVEQSFVIESLPASGDLVIEGTIDSGLRARSMPADDGGIEFADETGQSLVRYGVAVAFDANGRVTSVRSRAVEGSIVLTVSGEWLEDAELPVVVDPLIARTEISTRRGQFGDATSIGTAVQSEAEGNTVLVTYARQFTATDWDAFAEVADADFSNQATILADATTSWSTPEMKAGFVAGADRWVIAVRRDVRSGPLFARSEIGLFTADRDARTLGVGEAVDVPRPVNASDRYPQLGGTVSGSRGDFAMVVFQRDITVSQQNTSNSEAMAVRFNARTEEVGTPFHLGASPSGTTHDKERPTIQAVADGGPSGALQMWVAAWQSRDATGGTPWSVVAQRIHTTGVLHEPHSLSSSLIGHAVSPVLAGLRNRFLIAYSLTNDPTLHEGSSLIVQRFDWPDVFSGPNIDEPRPLATVGNDQLEALGLAHHESSRSQWLLAYRNGVTLMLDRIGPGGGVIEHLQFARARTHDCAIGFDARSDSYAVVYQSDDAERSVVGSRVVHDPQLGADSYGPSCGGSIASTPPWAGHDRLQIELTGAVDSLGLPATLMIGARPQSMPLFPYGLVGCELAVDPIVFLPSKVSVIVDRALVTIALPDRPVFLGDLYAQWLYQDPTAPLEHRLTSGLQIRVRR